MFSLKKTLLLSAFALATVSAEYKNYEECIKPGDFALTFDDGPSSEWTAMVLDVLKKENVKATFFVNGKNCMDVKNDVQAQELIKREVAEGHIIASHTYTHPADGITKLTDQELTDELSILNDLLYDLTGLKPAFFRPPLGEFTEANKHVIEGLGFTANVLWNLDSNDWKKGDNATANYFKYLDRGNASNNSWIALNHDIQKVTATSNLEIMIPIIRELGYNFVTIDECLGMSAYQNVNSLENKNIQPTPGALAENGTSTLDRSIPTQTILPADTQSNLKSGASATQTVSFISAIILITITLFNFL